MSSGIKYDTDKPLLADMLLDFKEPLMALYKVWEFGRNKYGWSNWKKVDNGESRFLNALLRHVFKIAESEYDEETSLLHCSHIIFNALAFTYFVLQSKKQEQKRFKTPQF
jgi:hypothetical protein